MEFREGRPPSAVDPQWVRKPTQIWSVGGGGLGGGCDCQRCVHCDAAHCGVLRGEGEGEGGRRKGGRS